MDIAQRGVILIDQVTITLANSRTARWSDRESSLITAPLVFMLILQPTLSLSSYSAVSS